MDELRREIRAAFDRGSYYYCRRLIARYKRLLNKERIGLYEQI